MMDHYIDRETGEIYAYESGDPVKPGLEFLDDVGLAEARAAQAVANAPTREELADSANFRRDSLLAMAALRVAPLQYAVDLETASADEAASLKAWKEYGVAVSRITIQSGFPTVIEWPVSPGGER